MGGQRIPRLSMRAVAAALILSCALFPGDARVQTGHDDPRESNLNERNSASQNALPPADAEQAPTLSERLIWADEHEERERAYRQLVGQHGYQPVFNGLKAVGGSWQSNIVAEDGARFFTSRSVMDSFVFILDPPLPGQLDKRPDPGRIHDFCAATVATHEFQRSATRRALGLCALADCDAVSARDWSAAVERVDPSASPRIDRSGAAEWQQRAHDAAFLFRVAALCGQAETGQRLLQFVDGYIRNLGSLRAQCGHSTCPAPASAAIRRFLSVDAHLLLAAGENPAVPRPVLARAAQEWLGTGLNMAGTRATIDPAIEELCEAAQIEPGACRRSFPNSYFLERQYLALSALTFSSRNQEIDFCAALQDFRDRFAREIEYRFGGESDSRFQFGGRCKRGQS